MFSSLKSKLSQEDKIESPVSNQKAPSDDSSCDDEDNQREKNTAAKKTKKADTESEEDETDDEAEYDRLRIELQELMAKMKEMKANPKPSTKHRRSSTKSTTSAQKKSAERADSLEYSRLDRLSGHAPAPDTARVHGAWPRCYATNAPTTGSSSRGSKPEAWSFLYRPDSLNDQDFIDTYAWATSFNTILHIDDSGSMQRSRWRETRGRVDTTIHSNGQGVTPFGKGTETLKDNRKIRYDNVLEGTLLGSEELALVDSGAQNFISESFLDRHDQSFDTSRSRLIRRADGSSFRTMGLVQLAWSFATDRKQHMVTFNVVPDEFCQYAITLGGAFLHSVNMLRSLAKKVLRMPRKCSIPRVRLQGGGSLGMRGYCDWNEVIALPDTASDVPLMSLGCAQKLWYSIESNEDTRVPLELPGNRIAMTSGIVRNVRWQYGEGLETHKLDFYVLEGLPVDILLDDDFLRRTEAFEKHAHLLTTRDDVDEDWDEDSATGLFLTILRLREEQSSVLNEAIIAIDREIDTLASNLSTVHSGSLSAEMKVARIAEMEQLYRKLLQQRNVLANTPQAHQNLSQQAPLPKISRRLGMSVWRRLCAHLSAIDQKPHASD